MDYFAKIYRKKIFLLLTHIDLSYAKVRNTTAILKWSNYSLK